MTVKPFRFQLSKVSAEDQALVTKLFDFLPSHQKTLSLATALQKIFSHHLGRGLSYSLENVETVTGKEFYSLVPEPCIVAVLGMAPLQHKSFLQIDPGLAHVVIDKLLGGEGEEVVEIRPLTDTEQGVLEYFILQVLKGIHQSFGGKQRCHFRLEQMVLRPEKIERMVDPKLKICRLIFHLSVLGKEGGIQLCLPHPFVVEGFLQDLPADRLGEDLALVGRIERLGTIQTDLWGELGEAEVSMNDLGALEPGDVVLFDHSGLIVSSGHWSGEVILRVGEGAHGGLRARWDGFHKKGEVEVKEVK